VSTCEFFHLNGRIVPTAEAQIPVFSAAVKYGAGVFEGLRAYWNPEHGQLYVFRMAEHIERLAFGARVLRFDALPPPDALTAAVVETLRANAVRESAHVRAIAYIESDCELIGTGPVGFVVGAVRRPSSRSIETGIRVAVSSWARIADNALPPRVKCTANYMNNRAAEIDARLDGHDGVLMLTADGKLSEASGACVFLLRRGVLATPDRASDILESITRDTVIAIARERLGIAVEERRVDRTELYAAEEVFWCGSGQEVTPIVAVDRRPVGAGAPGPVTRAVQAEYFNIVTGRVEAYPEWRHPVW